MNAIGGFFKGKSQVWLMVVLSLGCLGPQLPAQTIDNITQERKRRSEEAARMFEARRDFAEFQAALSRWNQRDVRGCAEGLQRLLQRNPTHRDARLLQTEIHLTENRLPQAHRQIERALLDHPNDARVQYTAGLVLDAMGQHSEGLAYYQRAVRLEPSNELYAVGYQKASEAAHRAGSGPAAAAAAPYGPPDALPKTAPAIWNPAANGARPLPPPAQPSVSHAAPNYPVGQALFEDNGSREQADHAVLLADDNARHSDSVRRVSHAEPADGAYSSGGAGFSGGADKETVLGLLRLGHAALIKGSRQAAGGFFKEAAALRPDNPQIPIFAAIASLRHNQPDLAIEVLTSVRQRFSDSAKLHRILGAAYHRVGDYRSSQVTLQRALSLDNSSPLTYFLMGCTLEKLGQVESAQAHFRQAQAIDPRYTARR